MDMSHIALFALPYSDARSIAQRVADRLAYRCIDETRVMERAALPGGAQLLLQEFLKHRAPLLLNTRRRQRVYRACCALIQATLAEEMAAGPTVCCGQLAYVLPLERCSAARIRVLAPEAQRIAAVQQMFGLT